MQAAGIRDQVRRVVNAQIYRLLQVVNQLVNWTDGCRLLLSVTPQLAPLLRRILSDDPLLIKLYNHTKITLNNTQSRWLCLLWVMCWVCLQTGGSYINVRLVKIEFMVNLTLFPCRKRVFLLGPSHHVYLPGCALSSTTHYETPLYNLEIDQDGEDLCLLIIDALLFHQYIVSLRQLVSL